MIQSRWDWETVCGATPETATGTGALPSKVPVGGRAQAPANGSLRWTNAGKGRLAVAARRIDNSPAFQCRVQSANDPSPAGTTDVCQSKSLAMAETEGHAFSRPGGTRAGAGDNPALKRRAIIAMSLRDEAGATPKTATGTGALPSNVPAGRPMAVWGGRTRQRAFEYPM